MLKRKDKQLLNRCSSLEYTDIPTYIISSILSDKKEKEHDKCMELIEKYHESLRGY